MPGFSGSSSIPTGPFTVSTLSPSSGNLSVHDHLEGIFTTAQKTGPAHRQCGRDDGPVTIVCGFASRPLPRPFMHTMLAEQDHLRYTTRHIYHDHLLIMIIITIVV